MPYSSLGFSNNLLHPGSKLSMCFTLKPHANNSTHGVYQLLAINKLIWTEISTESYLEIQYKLNLRQHGIPLIPIQATYRQ